MYLNKSCVAACLPGILTERKKKKKSRIYDYDYELLMDIICLSKRHNAAKHKDHANR